MTAEKYRDRVTFLRFGDGVDDYGNPSGAWQDHLTAWGDLLETLGKERIETGRIEARRTATLRVRYSAQAAGITEADAVRARGEVWNIRSVARVGRTPAVIEMLIESGVAV